MDVLFIAIIVAVIAFIAWAELLYYYAGKDNAVVFGALYALPFLGIIIGTIGTIIAANIFIKILSFLSAAYFTYVGVTIYEQAGLQDRKWYYATLLVNPLAILYQFVKK